MCCFTLTGDEKSGTSRKCRSTFGLLHRKGSNLCDTRVRESRKIANIFEKLPSRKVSYINNESFI